MIIVFVTHTHPPLVFESTPALLIAHAIDNAATLSTLPPAGDGLTFEATWKALTQDLKAAFHFPDLVAARAHFQHDDSLGLHARTTILTALDRLETARSAPPREFSASQHDPV